MSIEPSLTRVAVVRPAGGGRASVTFSTSSPTGRPVLQPMLLRSDTAGATVSLVPAGALLLAGDAIRLELTVGAGARLDIVEPAGTVAYAMHGAAASWDVTIDLEPAASLVWAGEPFVVAAGADVTRTTRIRLGWGALLALRETIVLGRHDEPSGRLRQELRATGQNGIPLLSESLTVGPNETPLLLSGARAVGTVLTLGCRTPGVPGPAVQLDLDACGTITRTLGGQAHAVQLASAWDAARQAMVSRPTRSGPESRTPDRALRPSRHPG